MRIAIIDDEKKYQNLIEEYIKTYKELDLKEIDKFDSGEDFLKNHTDYSLVFIDVEMPGKDGFETILEYKKIYKNTKFIIVTTHEELSRNGYKVEAFRYLYKSNLKEELMEALDSFKCTLKSKATVNISLKNGISKKVKINNIIYVETLNRKLLLHMLEDNICCIDTMYQMVKKLENKDFYLSHRSYLINMSYIEKINGTEILMKNGDSVLLSRRKNSDLKLKYMDYKFNEANK